MLVSNSTTSNTKNALVDIAPDADRIWIQAPAQISIASAMQVRCFPRRRPASTMADSAAHDLLCRASTTRRATTLDKFEANIGAMAATDNAKPQDANSAPCQVRLAMPVMVSWKAAATAPLKMFAPALNANRLSMLGRQAARPRRHRHRQRGAIA